MQETGKKKGGLSASNVDGNDDGDGLLVGRTAAVVLVVVLVVNKATASSPFSPWRCSVGGGCIPRPRIHLGSYRRAGMGGGVEGDVVTTKKDGK